MQGKVLIQGKWIFKLFALPDEELWKLFLRPAVYVNTALYGKVVLSIYTIGYTLTD